MSISRAWPAVLVVIALSGCGDDGAAPATSPPVTSAPASTTAETTSPPATEPTTEPVTTSAPTEPATTPPPATVPATTAHATTAPPATTPAVTLDQPAVRPAADVEFATPEEAAADFVESALGVEPLLGEFMAGDLRSGEIELLAPGTSRVVRGVLLLRRLAPTDGWFVIGVANDNATITSPETGAAVTASELTVTGVARGFEGTVVVTALVAGDAGTVLDEVVTSGGSLESPEPYSVTLDLGAAAPGDVVALLVRGGVGLETDPGELGAIPLVIAG